MSGWRKRQIAESIEKDIQMEKAYLVSQWLEKVNEHFTVTQCSNGYVVEQGGRDDENNWKTVKIVCTDIENLREVIEDILNMAVER